MTPRSPQWWTALPVAWAWDHEIAPEDGAELKAMEGEGLAERWRRPDGTAWCLTPWGAKMLSLKVIESRERESARIEIWAGVKLMKGGGWDLDRDGFFRDTFRKVAIRVVRETPHWAGEGKVEQAVVVPPAFGEVRGLSLDWLPGRPVEAEDGELAEAFEIEGEAVVLWEVEVTRERRGKKAR